ncbi:MAG: hypothetical protein KDK08_23990, partial [Rhizobiaceae bacterium]|nr:hypothetical protein [Rhizobiaceae bacterium]
DTVYCWSHIVDRSPLEGRADLGALRIRTIATKDLPCTDFPEPGGEAEASVLLDFDYWALMPRKVS